MTTLVAVRKNGEIAIAADSLTTFGDTRLSAQFDKSYDKMYADQAALLETGARRDLIHQMQGKIANERPYIVLNYQNVIEAHSPKWAGFVPSPMESLNPLSKQTLTEVHRTG